MDLWRLFYTTDYAICGHEVKTTERSPPDNLTQLIITQSKGFTRKGIKNISRSVMTHVCLVLSSQVKGRSTMVGNSAPAVDAQKVFKDTFNSLIKEDLSIDVEKYQGVLEHVLSKVDFSVFIGIYMLPSNLNLVIRKKEGYNNNILVSNTGMKIGSNKDINKNHKKTPVAKPNLAQHDPEEGRTPFNLRILTEKHIGEKLTITILIVGVGLIAYHFLQKINGISIIQNRWFRGKCTGTNFFVSRLTDHGAEERKRHDLALEKLRKARDEWDRNRMKRLDLINKRLRERNQSRAYIKNIDEAMLEYYHVFAKKIKPLSLEPELSDFYHPSEREKNGERLFDVIGIGVATYFLCK